MAIDNCTSTTGPHFSSTSDDNAACPPGLQSSDPSCPTVNSGNHEQSKLQDATGTGNGISGGALAGFPADNAFIAFDNMWQSLQTGTDAIIASSYIGYDFGAIKTNEGDRDRYSVATAVRKHIMAFSIKQSSNPLSRVTSARLERSDDGMKWYGVHVVKLPDDDCLNTILSRNSVPSRFWRLRPLEFTGGVTNRWGVTAFQMYHNYDPTSDYNIQDKIFLENRIELPSQTIFATMNFRQVVAALGRPLLVGDIIQLPSETQYSAELEPIEKWMEVTDTAWSTEGFTPGWQPTLIRAVLQPAYASEESSRN